MQSPLRVLTWGLLGLMTAGSMACTHGDKADQSDVSVTDEARTTPATATPTPTPNSASALRKDNPSTGDKTQTKTKKIVKRTDAAAARNAASAPVEGSEEEYAADVDAAMGDVPSTAVSAAATTASAAVNSEADNSKVNRLSDGDVGLSADQQGNSKADVEITRKIRRTLTSNKNLSVYAHNVKIITREGQVVLKGPVRSENERKIIEDAAVTVAGAQNVTSGIEIKPN